MSAHFERALLLFQQRRFDLAEKEVRMGLAQEPDHPLAHALLALCLVQREEYEAATGEAQRAIGLAPELGFAHATLARVLLARNRFDDAEQSVNEAIALDAESADHRVLKGQIALCREDWQHARRLAEEALALEPENVDAQNVRATALRKLSQGGSAEQQLLAALAIDPDDAYTHANLGWLYLEKGDREKATLHFRESLRLNPELETARQGVVATLKAKSPIYRLFLKYIFWMQKLGSQGRWTVILGAWFAFVIARRLSLLNHTLATILWPLIIGYIAFVFFTWLAEPLANFALRLHPFGRLALSRDETMAANCTGVCVAGFAVAGIGYLAVGGALLGSLAVFFGLMLMPVAATFGQEYPWPRKPMIIYTAVLAALGFGWVFVLSAPPGTFSNEAAKAPLSLTLLLRLVLVGFPIGALLSTFAANILMTIRWRR